MEFEAKLKAIRAEAIEAMNANHWQDVQIRTYLNFDDRDIFVELVIDDSLNAHYLIGGIIFTDCTDVDAYIPDVIDAHSFDDAVYLLQCAATAS